MKIINIIKQSMAAALVIAAISLTGCKDDDPVKVSGVSLNKSTLTLTEGAGETLAATVAPADAENKKVSWKSDKTGVATVDQSGKVTAVAAGEAVITVTTEDGGKTAACRVTVEAATVAVTGVSLDKPTATLAPGSSVTLTATVAPDDASNKTVSWASSKTDVATVDQSGKVTAVAAGEAVITVTTEDGGKTATCTVTVDADAVAVTGVSLDETSWQLAVGEDFTLTATVEPDDATNRTVSWASSNTSVATVDRDGMVTAVATGEAVITVTTEDGSKTATCVITVTEAEVPVTDVMLSQTNAALTVGESVTLSATVLPSNATNQAVQWGSTFPGICSVDQSGKVIALSAGTTGVWVSTEDGGKYAECTVVVSEATVAVTGVELDKATANLEVGQPPLNLTATVAPANAANKYLQWTSSDENRAIVFPTGDNTAMVQIADGATNGDVTITVTTTEGSFTAKCVVTVVAQIPVTGISLDQTTLNMYRGETTTYPPYATLEPSNTTFNPEDIEWTSSNPAVVSVSGNQARGFLTAHDFGTATITARAGEYTATCEVTVTFNGTRWRAYDPEGGNNNWYRSLNFHDNMLDRQSYTTFISNDNNNPYTWNAPVISIDGGQTTFTLGADGKLTDNEGWVYTKTN